MPVRYPARSCTLLSRMSPCPTDTPFPYTTLFRSPTDNTVVSALEALLQVAESRSQPVIAADGASVERGAVATYGLDYERLGYQTGEMAVQVLTEGADPAQMPVQTLEELSLVLHTGAAERIGLELPAELVDSADTVYE